MQIHARSSLRPLAWLLALSVVGSAAAAQASPDADRVAPLRQQAIQQSGSPSGLVALHRLYALKGELEELSPLEDALQAVAWTRRANPEIAALARFYAADIERARGLPNRASDELARLAPFTHFMVIGGFDNEGKAGLDRTYPPETEIDFTKRYPGKAREVSWRKLELSAPDGYVDLGSAVRPVHEAVVYAVTDLDVARDSRVVLHLGASGASRLYVDGQKVLEDKSYHPAGFDQRAVAVNLRKGTHRVMLKLAHDEGAMGFYLRASGPRGEAVPAVLARLPDKAVTPPRGSLQPEVIAPLIDQLAKRVKQSPNDAKAHAEYAEAMAFTRTYDAKQRLPQQESARAAELAPSDADIQLLAAKLEDEDPNQRQAYLEAAAAAAPDLAEPQLELARDELNRGHPERALSRLKSLATHADSAQLQLLWARAEDDLGDFASAQRRVAATVRAHPRAVAAVREAARYARRLDRHHEVVGNLRVLLSLRYDDLESRRALIQELIALGQVDAAIQEQDRLLQLDPTDVSAMAHRAELLAYNGRAPEARAGFARAEALCPDEADLREREGRALLALGDKPGAQRAFESSLALRPQNPRLKEALRTLKGDEHGFGESFAADARALIAALPPMKDQDSEVLSELTAVKVHQNGTSTRLVQQISRANTDRGVDALRVTSISYSPDRQEVSVLRARIYRADGSVVEAHSEGDQSLSEPWAGIYYDARARMVGFPSLQPGDVVELMYRVDDAARDNLLSDYFGDLQLLQGESPKHHLSYVLEAPTARPIYASTPRIKPVESTKADQKNGTTLYKWAWNEVPRIVSEPSMPGWGEASASLHVSTYKDWASVGRFYWGLVRDQLVATDEVKRTAQDLARGLPPNDDLAKVRAVYDFVVTQTRYVGLEFGIHGYKPYAVDRILSRHFGDCKDKASLMHALLEQLGVPSNMVLLRMKHLGDVGTEPASLAIFNHAILYVPKFDMYLDGTAEYFGSGELPGEDLGAMVLVVKPEGESQIGHTPEGKPDQNRTVSTYDVMLKPDGSAMVTAQSEVRGLNAPDYRRSYATPATRRATFEQAWSRTFPGLSVEKVDLGDMQQLEQPVKLSFAMQVPHYAELAPAGISFAPFSKVRSYVESYAPLSQRSFDIVLPFPWENHFTYRYKLPANASVGALPAAYDKDTAFGGVHLAYRKEGNLLVCEGTIRISTSRVKVSDYAAFRGFLGDLDQALSRRVELKPSIAAPNAEKSASNP